MSRTVREVQDEYERETGERPTRFVARWILEQEAEARYQRTASGGNDPAPAEKPVASVAPQPNQPVFDPDAAYELFLENQGAE